MGVVMEWGWSVAVRRMCPLLAASLTHTYLPQPLPNCDTSLADSALPACPPALHVRV